MLSIVDIASSSGNLEIGNPFVVPYLELLSDQSVKIWFTRPALNAATVGNYMITGDTPRSVVLVQYETTQIVRLYFDQPLVAGQWTLQISSSIVSDDGDSLALPANTQVVFDVADSLVTDSVQEDVSDVAKFVPKRIRNKKGIADLLAAFQAGDDIVSEQARLAFDQCYLATAKDKYLTIRAADKGIKKPEKLGMQDDAFAKLAISLINNKLTNQSMLAVLEAMYGSESVHGFVESATETFRVFSGGTLEFLVDGKHTLSYILDLAAFRNPMAVTAIELAGNLNAFFANNDSYAFAESTSGGTVRIFSSTKGLGSSIQVIGGTLQPYLQFNEKVFAYTPESALAVTWTITNPSVGVVRFQPSTWPEAFTNLRIGDYVVLTGENVPEDLRGSWPVSNVNYSYSGATLIQWFEIESDYEVS